MREKSYFCFYLIGIYKHKKWKSILFTNTLFLTTTFKVFDNVWRDGVVEHITCWLNLLLVRLFHFCWEILYARFSTYFSQNIFASMFVIICWMTIVYDIVSNSNSVAKIYFFSFSAKENKKNIFIKISFLSILRIKWVKDYFRWHLQIYERGIDRLCR